MPGALTRKGAFEFLLCLLLFVDADGDARRMLPVAVVAKPYMRLSKDPHITAKEVEVSKSMG